MSRDICTLDPDEDGELFDEAFSWLATSPPWRRATEAVFGTLDLDEYLAAAHSPGRVDIGVFDGGELVALVTFTIRAKGVYEVHLEAKPGASAELVTTAGCLIRDQIFGKYGAQMVFAWVPKCNRPVRAVLKAIGFSASHVTMRHGIYRDRVIEWEQLSIGVVNGQQEAGTDPNPEPGSDI